MKINPPVFRRYTRVPLKGQRHRLNEHLKKNHTHHSTRCDVKPAARRYGEKARDKYLSEIRRKWKNMVYYKYLRTMSRYNNDH